jgi:hypothetical protein
LLLLLLLISLSAARALAGAQVNNIQRTGLHQGIRLGLPYGYADLKQ